VEISSEYGNEHLGFINAGQLSSSYTTGGILSSS
jgi:hypothetical protein